MTYLAEGEKQTHVKKEDTTMVKEEIMKNQTNDVGFVRITVTKKKVVGIKASHIVIIVNFFCIFKMIVTLEINKIIHLLAETKHGENNLFFGCPKRTQNIKMYSIWTIVATVI